MPTRRPSLVTGCLSLLLVTASLPSFAAPSDRVVLVARLEEQAISPGTARYIDRAVRTAEEEGAECLIIRLDTPGGLLQSTRQIVKRILASRVCVVVYVAPSGAQAASAGVFIGLASHVLAMAPGTTIGAAHPVQAGGLPVGPSSPSPEDGAPGPGEDGPGGGEASPPEPGSPMEEKIVKSTVAWARSLAERRGRNADWAERAVSESTTATAAEALELGVAEIEADDLEELLERLDGREVELPRGRHTLTTSGAETRPLSMWWGERLLSALASPNLAFLLLMFGFYGILFEFYSPGWGVSGTLGVICLLLGLFGLAVLPVNYLGLLLIALAIGLFVAEAFVTSFGTLALAGVACLIFGGLMLVDSPEGFSRVSLGVLVPVAAATGVITVILVTGIVRAYRGGARSGTEGLVRETARAEGDFQPEEDTYRGTVLVHGERWRAESPQPVRAGHACRITGREGLLLRVLPVTPEAGQTGAGGQDEPSDPNKENDST